jgi:hypothetical protein
MLRLLAEHSVVFRLQSLVGIPLQFLVSFLLLWLARFKEGSNGHKQAEVVSRMKPRRAVVQYTLHPTPFEIEVPELCFPEKPEEQQLHQEAEDIYPREGFGIDSVGFQSGSDV